MIYAYAAVFRSVADNFQILTLMMVSISSGCNESNLLSFGTSSAIDRLLNSCE